MNTNLLPSTPKYKNARATLLLVIAFSLINVFAYFAGSYFYFSSRIALVLVAIGDLVDNSIGTSLFKIIFGALAIASLVPYLLSWIFSKKKAGWMIVALVLFSVDTLVLLIDVPSIIANGGYTIIIDVVIHAVVLFELAVGVKAGYSMKKEAITAAEQAQTLQEENSLNNDTSVAEEGKKRSIVFTREKSFAGCAIPLIVYTNGQEVCKLKNGESKTLEVPSSAFELSVMMSNGFANAKEVVEAGEDQLNFSFKIKMGFSNSSIEITKK